MRFLQTSLAISLISAIFACGPDFSYEDDVPQYFKSESWLTKQNKFTYENANGACRIEHQFRAQNAYFAGYCRSFEVAPTFAAEWFCALGCENMGCSALSKITCVQNGEYLGDDPKQIMLQCVCEVSEGFCPETHIASWYEVERRFLDECVERSPFLRHPFAFPKRRTL